MLRGLSIAVLCVILSIVGCGRREDRVVAEVAGEQIRVRDVEAAYAKLPPAEKKGAMQTLQILIDRELLIVEAQNRGMGENRPIQEALRQAEMDKVWEVHRKRLAEGIEVSEEEMRRYFEEKGLDARTEVRASHIEVETQEEAEDILKELEKGADFAELARERSIDKASAAKDGDLGYWERGRMIGATARKIFSMEVGETSEPFRSEQGYHIIRVTDERPVGFEAQKPRIEKRIKSSKLREKERAYIEDLKEQSGLQVNEEALARLRNGVSLGEVRADSTWLLTFDGGAITLGQYSGWVVRLKPRRRPAPGDSAQVVQFAEQIALNTVLLPRAFREAGLYETEEVRSHLEDQKKKRMVEELRRIEVEEKVVTDAAMEAYYRAHLEDYFEPETIRVEAMWTETMKEARKVFHEIQAGVDMAQVAKALESPSDSWRNYQVFRFHPSDEAQERLGIVRAAEKTGVGQLGGPVRVSITRRGQPMVRYSVFRVLDKTPAHQRALEERGVQRDIRRNLGRTKRAEIEQRFQMFLLELRKRYADRMHIVEKNLKLVSLEQL